MTHLFCNWNFDLLISLTYFSPPLTLLPSGNHLFVLCIYDSCFCFNVDVLIVHGRLLLLQGSISVKSTITPSVAKAGDWESCTLCLTISHLILCQGRFVLSF